MADLIGIERRKTKTEEYQELMKGNIPSKLVGAYEWAKLNNEQYIPVRAKILCGELEHKENGVLTNEYSKLYNKSKYKFFLEAEFEISSRCCSVMKKTPIKAYSKETKRKPITAQMASESKLRTSQWIKNGCNGFEMKSPISNPMSFWTEQDVLQYIKTRDLPICSVYGEIVEDLGDDQIAGQMTISDLEGFEDCELFDAERPLLKTTGCNRTGCMFCGYGCHLEKEEDSRFLRMKETHPKQYEWIMKPWDEGGLGYAEVIDWINEHGNLNIRR